jgi:putative ABC transport system permease protein
MIAHLFRVTWNRRRRTGLILVEILVSFLILCGLFTFVFYATGNLRKPLGFDYHDVWRVSMDFGRSYFMASPEEQAVIRGTMVRVEQAIEDHPDVLIATCMGNVPFDGATASTTTWIDGERVSVLYGCSDPDTREVMGFELLEGRWFGPEDQIGGIVPVVITRDLARSHFGLEDPLGRMLPAYDENGNPEAEPEEDDQYRVIGVAAEYRYRGDLAPVEPCMFFPFRPDDVEQMPPFAVTARVRTGASARVEEEITDLALGVAPDWDFGVARVEDLRADVLKGEILPFAAVAVISTFLILMVGMGLIGVLWQSVVRRTDEIGLRRAVGSTAVGVRALILGELLALATIAAGLGTVIILQLPILGVTPAGWGAYLMGVAAALAAIYGFVLLCGLYPSRLATRVQPAEALTYE